MTDKEKIKALKEALKLIAEEHYLSRKSCAMIATDYLIATQEEVDTYEEDNG